MHSTNKPSPLPLPKKTLQIKQDDKFFSKLLSKETSAMTNNNNNMGSSFRIYYGDVSGSVPFTWESHPGTPKHHRAFSETTEIPPLTPPPSYFSNSGRKMMKNNSRSSLLRSLLLKLNLPRKSSKSSCLQSSPSFSSMSSWSSSNSSMSVQGTPSLMMKIRKRTRSSRALSFGSSVSSKVDDDEEEVVSPTSVLCFGGGRSSSSSAEFVKKAWLSVVGHYDNGANN